jgi:hypothetical protein
MCARMCVCVCVYIYYIYTCIPRQRQRGSGRMQKGFLSSVAAVHRAAGVNGRRGGGGGGGGRRRRRRRRGSGGRGRGGVGGGRGGGNFEGHESGHEACLNVSGTQHPKDTLAHAPDFPPTHSPTHSPLPYAPPAVVALRPRGGILGPILKRQCPSTFTTYNHHTEDFSEIRPGRHPAPWSHPLGTRAPPPPHKNKFTNCFKITKKIYQNRT